MRREQFEHVIAAAAEVTGTDEFVVIGSQAILGPHPDAPASLLRSIEADIYPVDDPRRADLIDGALGDGSRFQRAYGYYAHGVGAETAKPPAGWRARLVRIDIQPRVGSPRRPVACASSRTTSFSPSAWPAEVATGISRATRSRPGSSGSTRC